MMKFRHLYLTICAAAVTLTACAEDKKTADAPMKVIFDTDMGNDIDDALALDMLYKYAEDGKVEILAITSNKVEPASVEYIDILNTFYGFPDIPIGKLTGIEQYHRPNSYAMQITADTSYKRTVEDYDALPESVDLMRKVLAEADDNSVVIIATGFFTNPSRLLDSAPDAYSDLAGPELIKKKVKELHFMAGDFRKEGAIKEHNVVYDIPAAQNVYANWPGKIVTSPFDVGSAVLYPVTSILGDFNYVEKHPLAEAYKVYKPMPYDRQTWDLTSVLYAVEPGGGYFGTRGPGTITVDHDGMTWFKPGKEGKHVYLTIDGTQEPLVLARFLELITRRPAACNGQQSK